MMSQYLHETLFNLIYRRKGARTACLAEEAKEIPTKHWYVSENVNSTLEMVESSHFDYQEIKTGFLRDI